MDQGPPRDPGSQPQPDDGRVAQIRRRAADLRQRATELEGKAQQRLASERTHRGWVGLVYDAWDLDRHRGGPLLAGGLAYRVFLWELPVSLFLVSLFGVASKDLQAGSPAEVARSSGLSAAVADLVAEAVRQTSSARWWLIVVGAVLTVWAGRGAIRAVVLTSTIAWALPPSGVPGGSIRGSLAFTGVMLVGITIGALVQGLFALGFVGDVVAWAVVSLGLFAFCTAVMSRLPRREAAWTSLMPGALLVTVALRGLSLATEVYFADRLERVSDLYGGLGTAIVILLYLYLGARSFVWAQFLNARVAGVTLGEGRSYLDAIAEAPEGPPVDSGP